VHGCMEAKLHSSMRSIPGSVFLGSVAKSVVRRASCPFASFQLKPDMRTLLLVLVGLVLPLIWGWGMHRLLAWLWPATLPSMANQTAEAHQLDALTDYQI
jgi:hypothetical protein